jgi:hypothetical protein
MFIGLTGKEVLADDWYAGQIGAYTWKENGITTKEEAMKWAKVELEPSVIKGLRDWGESDNDIYEWSKICTAEGSMSKYAWNRCVTNWKKLSMTPQKFQKWKKAGIYKHEMKNWLQSGITSLEEIQKWKKAFGDRARYELLWYRAGVKEPADVKLWKEVGVDYSSVVRILQNNITLDDIKAWRNEGISIKADEIVALKKAGFNNVNEYKPYHKMDLTHAIRLKQWNVVPDKLIKSMSSTNKIVVQELYFHNMHVFKKSYAQLKKHCKEIQYGFFSADKPNIAKDQCYPFVVKVQKRLDKNPFFGKATKNVLANGMSGRNVYIENLQNDWKVGQTRYGIMKGTGSFSHNSKKLSKGMVILDK